MKEPMPPKALQKSKTAKNDHKYKGIKKLTQSITRVCFLADSTVKSYGDPRSNIRHSGWSKMAKNRPKIM